MSLVLLKKEEICVCCDTQYIVVFEEEEGELKKPEYCPFCGSSTDDPLVTAWDVDDEE